MTAGRSKTGKVVSCKRCGKKFYITASDIKKDGNCCSKSCAAKLRWNFREETRGDRWTRAISERIVYKLKHTPVLCNCGRLFIQTRGNEQTECLFCLNGKLHSPRTTVDF